MSHATHCSVCGKKLTRVYPDGKCQSCYRYFLLGGKQNQIPLPGTIEYDERGYVICHICGRSYRRLGSHIKESHNMTAKEYKERFGLCDSAKMTEIEYSQYMRDLAYKYEMPKQLMESGVNTRIRKGEKDRRYGKKARLQECLEKRARRRGDL